MHRPDVIKFFAEHHWVASVEQLHASCGVDDSAIYRARQLGLVHVTDPRRSSSSADVELSFEGRALLAQLAGRRGGVRQRAVGRRAPRAAGHADATRSRSPSRERRRLSPADVGPGRAHELDRRRARRRRPERDGLRVATPLRMLFGLAAAVQPAPLRAGGRGRVAQGARHARRRRRLPRARSVAPAGPASRRMNTWLEKTAAAAATRPRAGSELDFVAHDRAGRPADAEAPAPAGPRRPAS